MSTSENSGRSRFDRGLGFARLTVLLLLAVTIIPAVANAPMVHATKPPPPPPPSTGGSFAKVYGGWTYASSVGESVVQTSSGGYVVGALCDGGSACNGYATVMRMDLSGNIQSQTQYQYTNYPYTVDLGLLRSTSDGGAIFAANAQFGCPAVGQTSCAAIVKVDSSGKVQWNSDLQFSSSCSGGPFAWPLDLQQTTDGGYVVTGYAYAPTCTYSPFVVKLASSGQLQWERLFSDSKSQYSLGYAVRQTPDGGYVVAGGIFYYVSSSYTESEILVFKLDSTGSLVWQREYSMGTDSYTDSIGLTSDGGFIVSGTVDTNATTGYSSSVVLLKLDSVGNPQFARTYLPTGDISQLTLSGAQQTADGGYAFDGYYFQNTIYTQRAWLVKTDSAGNVQWDKIYGADVQYNYRDFRSFQQTSDGGFIATGSTNQYNTSGGASLWLVKTDSKGNISNCADVKSASDTSSSVTVKVGNSGLAPLKDGFTYVADALVVFTGPFTATKEC